MTEHKEKEATRIVIKGKTYALKFASLKFVKEVAKKIREDFNPLKMSITEKDISELADDEKRTVEVLKMVLIDSDGEIGLEIYEKITLGDLALILTSFFFSESGIFADGERRHESFSHFYLGGHGQTPPPGYDLDTAVWNLAGENPQLARWCWEEMTLAELFWCQDMRAFTNVATKEVVQETLEEIKRRT